MMNNQRTRRYAAKTSSEPAAATRIPHHKGSRIRRYLGVGRTRLKRLFILLLVIVCIVLAAMVIHDRITPPVVSDGTPFKADPALKSATGSLTKGTPEYATVLPAGRSIDDFGGWTRVSPPDRNPVFAYADKLSGTPIIVSEQPLPKGFNIDTDAQVQQVANGYGAKRTIKTGNTSIFVADSVKGPQSVIFSKKSLLILVKASAKVTDDAWKSYVSSLK